MVKLMFLQTLYVEHALFRGDTPSLTANYLKLKEASASSLPLIYYNGVVSYKFLGKKLLAPNYGILWYKVKVISVCILAI